MKLNEVIQSLLLESFKDARRVFTNEWPDDLVDKTIATFKEVKPKMRGEEKDISYWIKKGFGKFYQATMAAKFRKTKGEKRKEIKADQNYDVVLDNDRATIYVPLTHEASCKLGSNTDWCISKPHQPYYKEYTEQGKVFFMVHLTEEEFESGEKPPQYGKKFTIEVNAHSNRLSLWTEENRQTSYEQEYLDEYLFDGEWDQEDFYEEAQRFVDAIAENMQIITDDRFQSMLNGDLAELEKIISELKNKVYDEYDPEDIEEAFKKGFGSADKLHAASNSLLLSAIEEINSSGSIGSDSDLAILYIFFSRAAHDKIVEEFTDTILEAVVDVENKSMDVMTLDVINDMIISNLGTLSMTETDDLRENVHDLQMAALSSMASRYINDGDVKMYQEYLDGISEVSDSVAALITEQPFYEEENSLHPIRLLFQRAKENPYDENIWDLFEDLEESYSHYASDAEYAWAHKELEQVIERRKQYGDTENHPELLLKNAERMSDGTTIYRPQPSAKEKQEIYDDLGLHDGMVMAIDSYLHSDDTVLVPTDSEGNAVAVLSYPTPNWFYRDGDDFMRIPNSTLLAHLQQRYESFAESVRRIRDHYLNHDDPTMTQSYFSWLGGRLTRLTNANIAGILSDKEAANAALEDMESALHEQRGHHGSQQDYIHWMRRLVTFGHSVGDKNTFANDSEYLIKAFSFIANHMPLQSSEQVRTREMGKAFGFALDKLITLGILTKSEVANILSNSPEYVREALNEFLLGNQVSIT